MSQHPQNTRAIRVADLSARRPVSFDLAPDAAEMARITADLGLLGLRKLRLRGSLTAEGRADWLLRGNRPMARHGRGAQPGPAPISAQ